jgi:putative oxidoreductase
MWRDLGVLLARSTVGGLLAGHGSQKLFGWFGGGGLEGTGGYFEGMGFRPGTRWAALSAASELGGGLLTALGFLNPVGPLAATGSMLVATLKAHAGKPIWSSQGGAELPVTNMAVLAAIAVAGPGRLSVDHVLGTRLPRWTLLPGAAIVGGLTWFAVRTAQRSQAEASAVATDGSAAEAAAPARLETAGEPGPTPIGTDLPATAGMSPEEDVEQPLGEGAVAAVRRSDPDAR